MEDGLYLDFSTFEDPEDKEIETIRAVEDKILNGEITKEEAAFLLGTMY